MNLFWFRIRPNWAYDLLGNNRTTPIVQESGRPLSGGGSGLRRFIAAATDNRLDDKSANRFVLIFALEFRPCREIDWPLDAPRRKLKRLILYACYKGIKLFVTLDEFL